MSDRPIWLLDVDGVINGSRSKAGWHAAPAKAPVTDPSGDTWTLHWAPPLITAIKGIHQEGLAEITWATTWCPQAHLLEQLWGLPELPRAWTGKLYGFNAVEAKRAAARQAIAAGRRLLWTDDDVFPASGWPDREILAGGKALLIKPHPDRGLRPEHLDLIHDFLAGGPGTAEVVFDGGRQ